MDTRFGRRAFVTAAFIAMLAAAAACGQWTPPAPTAPSQFRESPASGATISGTVNGGTSGNAMLAASTSNMTVTVVGTDISSSVSFSGKFVLKGVPAGNVTLRFTAPGIDVNLAVGSVGDREMIDLSVKVEASGTHVESFVRIRVDNSMEIEGDVTQMSGTCPNLTVVIHGWTVNLDASVTGGCGDISIGVKIKIKGTRSGNIVIVVKVEVEGHDEDDDDDDDHDDDDDD